MKYIVDIKEVWIRSIEVEADNNNDAVAKANLAIEQGEEELQLEYSHTLDTDLWTIYNVDKDYYES